jgi:hypothetical protein
LRCRPGTAVKLLWPAVNPALAGENLAIQALQLSSPSETGTGGAPARYHKKLPNSPGNDARVTTYLDAFQRVTQRVVAATAVQHGLPSARAARHCVVTPHTASVVKWLPPALSGVEKHGISRLMLHQNTSDHPERNMKCGETTGGSTPLRDSGLTRGRTKRRSSHSKQLAGPHTFRPPHVSANDEGKGKPPPRKQTQGSKIGP